MIRYLLINFSNHWLSKQVHFKSDTLDNYIVNFTTMTEWSWHSFALSCHNLFHYPSVFNGFSFLTFWKEIYWNQILFMSQWLTLLSQFSYYKFKMFFFKVLMLMHIQFNSPQSWVIWKTIVAESMSWKDKKCSITPSKVLPQQVWVILIVRFHYVFNFFVWKMVRRRGLWYACPGLWYLKKKIFNLFNLARNKYIYKNRSF